jgi:hypothetical protein
MTSRSTKKEVLFSKSVPLGGYHISANGIEKHIVVEDSLDSGNMTKSLKKKQQKELIKLVKSTRAPPMLPYPGYEGQERTGVLNAVYYEDILKEEEELKKTRIQQTELTSEELMRDEDYLKIDQSKLPLEIFDDLEFEARDRAPADWIASGSSACAPYYSDGAWTWRPVRVLGFDTNLNQYRIQLIDPHCDNGTSMTKMIHRLNLKFDIESEASFHTRHESAERVSTEC